MRILFFGDSITQGFWDSHGGWVERIRKHYDDLAREDLQNNNKPEVFNLGVSGDTTINLITRIENEIVARKWQDDALVVVIAIGTNDNLIENDVQRVLPDHFKSNIVEIVDKVRNHTNKLVLVGIPACDESFTSPVSWGNFYYKNSELQSSEKIIQQFAEKNSILFVPLFDEFKTKMEAKKLLADKFHPNDEGHKIIAEKVLDVISGIKPCT